jgi:branched-chain amino acid transport system substrate-binding protein
MKAIDRTYLLAAAVVAVAGAAAVGARADEIIKLGLTTPLSGAAANWGKGTEWMCNKAAAEVKAAGGVKVNGKVYNFECVAYDNKYSSSEGTKVAQTLLNRDGIRFIYGFGTAPILALQSMSERAGAALYNTSWGKSSKGPQFPLTVQVNNTPVEMMPQMVRYIRQAHPDAKTIALLNVNDATGHEGESISHGLWERAGFTVVASDFYERGTTEFQPIAARIAALKTDIVDVASAPAADTGQVFKELGVLGYKGIKVQDNGSGVEALMATGGQAVNGTYMGYAMVFDGPTTTAHQKQVNAEHKAALGESIGLAEMGAYDMVYMTKAGMEKAQSTDAKQVVAALLNTKYTTFFGGESWFGGKADYGSDIAPLLPVYITQVVDGKLVEKAQMDPRKQ